MTVDRDALLALALRVEGLAGPNRDIDAEIARHHGLRVVDEGHPLGRVCYDADHRSILLPRYTASLDAAMTLAGDGWFLRVEPRFYSDDGQVRWRAYAIKPDWSQWSPHDDWFAVIGPIDADKAPLALVSAALRTLAQPSKGDA